MHTSAAASRGSSSIGALVLVLVFCAAFWNYFGDEAKASLGTLLQNDPPAVLEATAQYSEAEKSGSLLQLCVRASVVSKAYRDAQDAANYDKWKTIERANCDAALK